MSRHAKRTIENTAAADVKLEEEEAKAIWDFLARFEVAGSRYVDELGPNVLHLWG